MLNERRKQLSLFVEHDILVATQGVVEAVNPIKIALCDDDQMMLDTYTKLCQNVGGKHGIDTKIKAYKSGNDLMFDLEEPMFRSTLDLLFLDITMPGLNGVEVAREARELGYNGVIVFITGSKDYYSDAFDVRAFHYIVKGESSARFEEIFLSAVELSRDANRDEIVLSGWGELRNIKRSSIEYFKTANGVVTVRYDNQEFEFLGSLNKLEDQLKGYGFFRIHRNFLVSLSQIKSISYGGVIMAGGEELPVGRKYYPELKSTVNSLAL